MQFVKLWQCWFPIWRVSFTRKMFSPHDFFDTLWYIWKFSSAICCVIQQQGCHNGIMLIDCGNEPWMWTDSMLYSEEGHKSTDWLSRAAGMKKIWSWSYQYPSPPSLGDDFFVGNQFKLNQLVATFICTNDIVLLAIIQVSGIKDAAGNSVSSIDSSALLSHDVSLRGQALTLIQCDGSSWAWSGSFESFTADKKPPAASHQFLTSLLLLPKP